MGEFQHVIQWIGGLGGATTMALALFAIHKRWFVTGDELRQVLADRDREREGRERAEQRLIDTIPVLTRAYEQISRVPQVAEKAVTTVAAVAETTRKDRKP